MSRQTSSLVILPLAVVALTPSSAVAAESYENCTGFINAVPAVLSTQGTWCLDGDLATSITSGAAITIAANNVTLDCNGFKLGGLSAGPGTNATGVAANNRLNSTVRNCGIRGFYRGLSFEGWSGGGHLVEDNRFDQNIVAGIVVSGSQNLVRRNRVLDTVSVDEAAFGIFVAGDAFENIVDVVQTGGTAKGIYVVGDGSVVARNQVRGIVGAAGSTGINTEAGEGTDISIIDNQVIKVPAGAGRGIWGTGNVNTHCRGNIVVGWTTEGISICGDAGGNYVQ